jgi:hypothetical protein
MERLIGLFLDIFISNTNTLMCVRERSKEMAALFVSAVIDLMMMLGCENKR